MPARLFLFRITSVFLLAMQAAGCAASSRELYGTTARYDPDFHSWTAEGHAGNYWLFRDPLTGCAVRCREQLAVSVALGAEKSRAANRKKSEMGTALALTFPLSVPGVVLLLPAFGIAAGRRDKLPSAEFRAAGNDARKRGAWVEATQAYLHALWRGDRTVLEPLAQVFLEQGRSREAVLARQRLVCAGGKLSDAEWQRIEAWLQMQNGAPSACEDASREPFEIQWQD